MSPASIRKRLRAYRALDNDLRLKTYVAIVDNPRISFSDLSRKMKIEKGLLAYHLGVLRTADLISVVFERRGKTTTKYNLTPYGRRTYREIQPRRPKRVSRMQHPRVGPEIPRELETITALTH